MAIELPPEIPVKNLARYSGGNSGGPRDQSHSLSHHLSMTQQMFVYQILALPFPCELSSFPLKSQTPTLNIFTGL